MAPMSALGLVLSVTLYGMVAEKVTPDASSCREKGTCSRSATPVLDWNFLQLSAASTKHKHTSAAAEAKTEASTKQGDTSVAAEAKAEEAVQPAVAKPGATGKAPEQECCDTDEADCHACEEGVSVQEWCTGHSGAVGCEGVSTVPSTTTPGTTKPEGTACAFGTEPVTPYFWDETCKKAPGLGCMADGISAACRFCGAGAYEDVPCPTCTFATDDPGFHYWDNSCRADPSQLGCLADGTHPECRFCGHGDFEAVLCPQWVKPTPVWCWFPVKPETKYYWEPKCKVGMVGCLADGMHASCRWCGVDPYPECPP